jgi:hypothetical protein
MFIADSLDIDAFQRAPFTHTHTHTQTCTNTHLENALHTLQRGSALRSFHPARKVNVGL